MSLHASATSIQLWPIDQLVEYPRNPHDAAVDRMCASIREFGFKIPCLARSDGEVVGEVVDVGMRRTSIRSNRRENSGCSLVQGLHGTSSGGAGVCLSRSNCGMN